MKKILMKIAPVFVLVFLLSSFAQADVTLTSDGKVPGKPFEYLQQQIDSLSQRLEALECHDKDGDGFYLGLNCTGPIDCDDNNININPGAEDIACDGIDYDCDGEINEGCFSFFDKEPNDNFGDAQFLSTVGDGIYSIKGDVSGDADVYLLNVDLPISFYLAPVYGQVTFAIYDNDEVLIESSESSIEIILEPGNYYIVVEGFEEWVGGYDLEMQLFDL